MTRTQVSAKISKDEGAEDIIFKLIDGALCYKQTYKDGSESEWKPIFKLEGEEFEFAN